MCKFKIGDKVKLKDGNKLLEVFSDDKQLYQIILNYMNEPYDLYIENKFQNELLSTEYFVENYEGDIRLCLLDEDLVLDDSQTSNENITEEQTATPEEQAQWLQLQEESKRILKQDADFKLPSKVKGSKKFNAIKAKADTIIYIYKLLLNNGVDYTNALSIANNLVTDPNGTMEEYTHAIGFQVDSTTSDEEFD